MAYETIVALELINEVKYEDYRKHMAPLLFKYEGGFRYDFKISETLKSENNMNTNRLFLIYFKTKAHKENFFNDLEYKKIRETYFTPSVKSTTILAEYERRESD